MHKTDVLRAAARGEAYRFLALAFDHPDGAGLDRTRAQWPVAEAGLVMLGRAKKAGDCVARCGAALEATTIEALRDAHVACFGHAVSKDCPPYEAEYGQAHVFEKTQTLADISGFYRAFGVELATGFKDRLDHLTAELEFMEFLCLKEARGLAKAHDGGKVALCRRAQREFLEEHLGRWAFGFVRRLNENAPGNVYTVFAELLAHFLAEELRSMRLKPGAEPFLNEQDADAGGGPDCAQCPIPFGVEPVASGGAP